AHRAVFAGGVVEVGDAHEAYHFQADVFQIEWVATGFLWISGIDVVLVGISQDRMMPGAPLAGDAVVRKLLPLLAVGADFHLRQLEEAIPLIVAGGPQKSIFEDDEIGTLAVEDFVIDEFEGDLAPLSQREHVIGWFKFSTSMWRSQDDLWQLVLPKPGSFTGLEGDDPIDIGVAVGESKAAQPGEGQDR